MKPRLELFARAVIVLATSIVPVLAADLDPCKLLTAAEIGSTLGDAPSSGKPDGPTIDKDLGAKSWSCDQQVGKLFFSINVVEFPAAAAPGLGDQAVWGASGEGAMWVTLKGKEDSYPD